MTDNRNRTAADIRHYFDKFGGNLGTTGCVSFMFAEKGVIIIDKSELDEEKVMEDCLEAGAIDFDFDDDVVEIFTDISELNNVKEALANKNYNFISAEIEQIPATYTRIDSPR